MTLPSSRHGSSSPSDACYGTVMALVDRHGTTISRTRPLAVLPRHPHGPAVTCMMSVSLHCCCDTAIGVDAPPQHPPPDGLSSDFMGLNMAQPWTATDCHMSLPWHCTTLPYDCKGTADACCGRGAPNVFEAPHLSSSIPHPKNDLYPKMNGQPPHGQSHGLHTVQDT